MKMIKCTRQGCDGVMVLKGGDTRVKKKVYECRKCGKIEVIESTNIDAGRYTFALNDPNDPLRGGLK